MKEQTVLPIVIGLSLLVLIAVLAPLSMGEVVVPEGYREWARVRSILIPQDSSLYHLSRGIERIYANEKAWKAMKDGMAYPEGTVFIFDLLEAEEQTHATAEGPLEMIGVMAKDSKRFAKTGGWGFAAFKGEKKERTVKDSGNTCFACHQSQKHSDYVFSLYRP